MVYGWSRCQADSARRPCGDRNSASLKRTASSRAQAVRPGEAQQQPLVAWCAKQQPAAVQQLAAGQPAVLGQQRGESLAHDHRQVDGLLVDNAHRERRQDRHERPDLEWHQLAGRRDQPVVVQAVGLVPQPAVVERLLDRGEVLDELQHDVGARPLPGPVQDLRHRHHRHRVERHPGGRVSLLQDAAHWQVGPVDRADVVQARGSRPRTGCCLRRPRGLPTR